MRIYLCYSCVYNFYYHKYSFRIDYIQYTSAISVLFDLPPHFSHFGHILLFLGNVNTDFVYFEPSHSALSGPSRIIPSHSSCYIFYCLLQNYPKQLSYIYRTYFDIRASSFQIQIVSHLILPQLVHAYLLLIALSILV